ncbi:AAA family ATPase [Psychromonas hadalis]|uniref:AAA family ATPase n=1 Tax=Psychromonas hadalis TaxID=211669 RepID=UPI0003B6F2A7|nr:AAA family ATPase [Psychromonas hadalis]
MVERTLISFPSQVQLIERLQHLLYLSSSMIFISGEKGSGKSTLIEQLSNQLPNKTLQAFISLAEPISASKIRQQIISQLFEDPLFDADASLHDTLLLLKDKQRADIARIVVIDNAELLPASLLIELCDVIKHKSQLSESEINFILLSGEQTNNQMLDTIKGTAIATLTFKLAALNQQEASQLLQHSFEQLGYSPKLLHQDALFKQLLLCNGIPQKILLLATEISQDELEDVSPSWFKTRFPALLLMLLLVAIAGGGAFYLYPKFNAPKISPEIIIETDTVLLDEIVATELITDVSTEIKQTEELAGQWSNDKEDIIDNQLSVGEADNKERVTISEQQLLELAQQTDSIDEVENEPLSEVSILAVQKPVVEKVVIEKPTLEKIKAAQQVEPITLTEFKVEPITLTEFKVKPITFTEFKIESVAASQSPEKQVIIVQAITELDVPIAVEKLQSVQQVSELAETDSIFTDKAFLLAVKPELYTLQLSAMSSEKSRQEFAETHQLPQKDVYLYQTIRNGKNWVVVIYGQFKTRQEANKMAKNLPNSFVNLDSWVKKYAAVHRDLQLNE